MPRTSTQTAGESREKSTTGAGSAFPPRPGTVDESPRSSLDLPNRVQSSVSATAKLSAHSPAPKPAPAGSYSRSPTAQTPPERSQSHRAVAEETSPGIAQTHG